MRFFVENSLTFFYLKVLTANIGTLMDLYGVEKGLEHYRSTQSLTFDHYIYYLQKEVRYFKWKRNQISFPSIYQSREYCY